MTTARWWWAADKGRAPVVVPVVAPDVVNPGNQTYYPGEAVELLISNVGGAADSWNVDTLPTGLVSEPVDGFTLRIYGTIPSLAPDVVNPGDQTYYTGESIDFNITNIGGPASTWTVDALPVGVADEVVSGSTLRIRGIANTQPDVINPGGQTYYVGETIDLQVTNTGGAATSWNVDRLPDGLTWEEVNEFEIRIYGTVTVPEVPQVVKPADQTFYVGETITPLVISNVGGNADSWTAAPLPNGLSITSETPSQIAISGRVTGDEESGPTIHNPGDQAVQVGVPFTLTIYNTGGPIEPGGWFVRNGWLPEGLSYDDSDPYQLVISGTPTG